MQNNNNDIKTVFLSTNKYYKQTPVSSLTIDIDNLPEINQSNTDSNTRTALLTKTKKNRTETFTWNLTTEQLTKKHQLESLIKLNNVLSYSCLQTLTYYEKLIKNHITHKILNYKYQDIHKDRFNHLRFTNLLNTIKLLITSKLTCHYCNKDVYILYEKVRENLQWTLDRINNDLGHNINNLVISCLECNISRKRIKKESFLFTKQLAQNKIMKLGISEIYQPSFEYVTVIDDENSDQDSES
jgi:hypothetical protein